MLLGRRWSGLCRVFGARQTRDECLIRTSFNVMSEDQPDRAAPVAPGSPGVVSSQEFARGDSPRPYRQSLLGEIERDVRERRRSGVITPEFEADLDMAWAEVSPPGATGGGFDSVADQAARHAIVDYDAPIVGSKPLRLVKRVVKLLTAWYMIFVGRQLVAFAGTSLRAMRILAGRVDSLERNTPATDPRMCSAAIPVVHDLDLSAWHNTVVDAVSRVGCPGRVAHIDCGDGALVVALNAQSIDGYGTDPRPDAGAAADEHNVEVRRDTAVGHLRGLGNGTLRAVVLSGCVDRLSLGDQLEVVSAGVAAVHPQGVVILIGRNPDAWSGDADPLARDLVVGRPLHCETWTHLLTQAGMSDVVAHFATAIIPPEIVASADAAVHLLAQKVFAPKTFCIVARRL